MRVRETMGANVQSPQKYPEIELAAAFPVWGWRIKPGV